MSETRIFSSAQLKFLQLHSLCRLAIADREGMPHVTPVVYAMDRDNPIIAVDYGTKKLRILQENRKVSLVVDQEDPNKGVVIQGECEIYERGPVYLALLDVLLKEIDFYKDHPWKEGESPILKITARNVASWGL